MTQPRKQRLRLVLLAFALLAQPLSAATLSESWFTSLILGKRIGYLHELRETVSEGGEKLVRTTLKTEITIQRMSADVKIVSQATFLETAAGVPVRFESVNQFSSSAYTIRAERQGDTFQVVQEAMGKKTETEVPFSPDVLFPHALERAIIAKALEPGAHLELRTFSPDAARPTRQVVDCRELEEVELFGGEKKKLLRLDTRQDVLPGVVLSEWRSPDGQVQRTVLPLLGLEIVSLRTTREQALLGPESVEVLVSTMVDPGTTLPRSRQIQRARYRLALNSGSVADLKLPEDSRQTEIGRDGNEIVLEVLAERWEKTQRPERPDRRYRDASSVVQSDDPKVRELAAIAAAPAGAPDAIARELNAWVHKAIQKKSLSVGLATAAEVARDLTGDCTEHAVLLAALARARGIPSKVAMGLVYFEGVFGYHMWTEVFTDGWHALDPALGQSLVDATHIKLGESALDQGFVDDGIISLVQVIANLGIRVVEYELEGRTYKPSARYEGTINGGVYENTLYGLRLAAPKKWRVMPRGASAGEESLLRIEGPAGITGEMSVQAIAADFRLRDWIDKRPAGETVVGRRNIAISKRPGQSYLIDRKGTREGWIAFLDRDHLFTVRLRPLGKKASDTLADWIDAIQLEDPK